MTCWLFPLSGSCLMSCLTPCFYLSGVQSRARTMAWHTPGQAGDPLPHSCPVIVRAPASVHCDTHHRSTSQPSQPAPSPSSPRMLIGHQTFSSQQWQCLSLKVKWLEDFVNDMTTLLSDLFMLWMFWAPRYVVMAMCHMSHVYFSIRFLSLPYSSVI